jgi:cell wall-associated NlpC family hydrolase
MKVPVSPPQVRLKEFRKLVGIPFVSGGRDPRIGLDCWGLFMLVHAMFGSAVPDVAVSCTELLAIKRTTQAQIRELWKPAPGPGPGVSVVMALDCSHPDIIQHFGVMLDVRNMIHCLQNTGVLVDNLDVLRGALCVKGFYQWNGPAC